MKASNFDWNNTQLILVYTNEDIKFIDELKEEINGDYPDFIKNMTIMDLYLELKDKRYPIDTHLKKEGHELIAESIIKQIQEA